MITKMFSVYDSKAQVFGVPFFMPNQGMALRSFLDAANDQQTLIYKHPEDFSLFLVGEFDDETGVCEKLLHQNLGTAASFVLQPKYNGQMITKLDDVKHPTADELFKMSDKDLIRSAMGEKVEEVPS